MYFQIKKEIWENIQQFFFNIYKKKNYLANPVCTPDILRPGFWRSLISHAALDYYLQGALKDKCYADKPETIAALKVNIREDNIGKIQLHTIDNVLKIGAIM